MSVRLDKWLQVARVFKTRSQATHAVDLNRVRVAFLAPYSGLMSITTCAR